MHRSVERVVPNARRPKRQPRYGVDCFCPSLLVTYHPWSPCQPRRRPTSAESSKSPPDEECAKRIERPVSQTLSRGRLCKRIVEEGGVDRGHHLTLQGTMFLGLRSVSDEEPVERTA